MTASDWEIRLVSKSDLKTNIKNPASQNNTKQQKHNEPTTTRPAAWVKP